MISKWWPRPALLLALMLFGLSLGGCAVNPATGQQSFTPFMSPAQEARIGRQEHPKIMRQFGGAYDDPEIQKYVTGIGNQLARTSELPNLAFTFTVLNSEVVNAFALPGGYVYVTRGLLALANDEAELAGVLAHEIGHITARHSAERHSRGIVTGLGAAVLGALSGERAVANLLQTGAELYVRSYSREQEMQADTLGVRYLSRVGYDTGAVASFLRVLQAHSRIEAQLAGKPGAADRFDLMATHPRTTDRVAAAVQNSGVRQGGTRKRAKDAYLAKIDGLLYGDDPKGGIVRGRSFAHPGLGFGFDVPRGFRIRNGEREVIASGPSGTLIVFDAEPQPYQGAMSTYLAGSWTQGAQLSGLASTSIGEMEAATARTRMNSRSGPLDALLFAIRFDASTIYRFTFISRPDLTAQMDAPYRESAHSFRRLSEKEAAALKPLRLRIHTVTRGESVATLAADLPFAKLREQQFRVLNGMTLNDELEPGRKIKIISE
jgi:predicted Zn-dependent protease